MQHSERSIYCRAPAHLLDPWLPHGEACKATLAQTQKHIERTANSSSSVAISKSTISFSVNLHPIHIPDDTRYCNDQEKSTETPQQYGLCRRGWQLILGDVHLCGKMHRHWPKSQAADDAHYVIEERPAHPKTCQCSQLCMANLWVTPEPLHTDRV